MLIRFIHELVLIVVLCGLWTSDWNHPFQANPTAVALEQAHLRVQQAFDHLR